MQEALRFMETEIDRPAEDRVTTLDNGFELRVFAHTFPDGMFTNVYDLSWTPGSAHAALDFTARPEEVLSRARTAPATATGAFFVLADEASGLPPQTSLNLAIRERRILSLPVVDREVLLCRDGELTTDHVAADGELNLNGAPVSWTGSRTGRTAESYVYGNGNVVIARRRDASTGSVRVLDEASRRTPAIPGSSATPAGERWADVGFVAVGDGTFRSTAVAEHGQLDIFAHDLVVRCRAAHLRPHGANTLAVTRIGALHGDNFPDFAVSVGPSLDVPDYLAHSINQDRSHGEPAFSDERRVRMVLFRGLDDRTHIRLYDGRPASPTFRGATPTEARDHIAAGTGYRWGCFLDGGQTAKMWVVEDGVLTSYGNRHYLRWPDATEKNFIWVPDIGRPVSSCITFRAEAGGALSLAYAAEGLRVASDLGQAARRGEGLRGSAEKVVPKHDIGQKIGKVLGPPQEPAAGRDDPNPSPRVADRTLRAAPPPAPSPALGLERDLELCRLVGRAAQRGDGSSCCGASGGQRRRAVMIQAR
ncbi:hypothetical protein [Yinghuangia sp. YIM S09857]|uniref:hypothetical protein n=1 Tax=Yinghuangia sp. YIM S09857 TaxID=3436929 RepID=UPI003F5330DA